MSKPIVEQIENYLLWCSCRNYTEDTIESKKYDLYQAYDEMDIDDLKNMNKYTLYGYIRNQKDVRRVKASTLNKRLKALRAMITYLSEELDVVVPVKLSQIPRLKEDAPRRKYYSREEIYEVMSLANHEDRLLLRLMFEMAMRLTEAISLRVDQINGREVTVVGKGRKREVLCMSNDLATQVELYIKARGISGYIFPSPHSDCDGRHVSKAAARARIVRAFKRAGLDGGYPHAIRHSRATDLKRNGASNDVVKEFLRHASVSTTEIYMHYFEGSMIKHFDKYTVLPKV